MTSATLSRRADQSPARTPVKPGKSRLFLLVLPVVAVILFQAFLAGLSLEVLSSVRAYVGGESIWSKGQKDAIHFLTLYAHTGARYEKLDAALYTRISSGLIRF